MVSRQGGMPRGDYGDKECSFGDGGLVRKEPCESASLKHALSERKRRKRINAHYDSLRRFFPRLHKADKASVLSETVRRLKELKNMIAEVSPERDLCSVNKSHRSFFIPGEKNEVTINYCNDGEKITVRAVICCEDRLDLNRGFREAIQSVGGKAVKAEMATVGGRTKAEVVVELPECGGRVEEDVGLLRRMLKSLVENRVTGQTGFMGHGFTEQELIGLRPRFIDGRNRIPNDQIENTKNGYADGLVMRS